MKKIDACLAKANLAPFDKQRRSQRVILDVPLLVRGENEQKHAFEEEAMALIVSAHGALVILDATVVAGQKVIIRNVTSGDEREGTVAFVSSAHAGLAKVGIQFDRPAPEFWSLSSPPADWKVS